MEERVAFPCPLCGSPKGVFLWESHDPHLRTADRYVKCPDCDLVRIDPRLADAELEGYWERFYGRRREVPGRRPVGDPGFVTFLARLRALAGGGRLLDVGCGEGTFLHAAEQCGFEPFGTEISSVAIESAKVHFGLTNVHLATCIADAEFPEGFFKVVCLMDVTEHLGEPKSELLEICRILSPDGIMVVRTPNVDALAAKVLKGRWHLCNSTHIVLFSLKTLSATLRACGFDLLSVEKDFSGEESLGTLLGVSRKKDLLAVGEALDEWKSGKSRFWRIPRQVAVVFVRRGLRYLGAKLGHGETLLVLARKAP